MVLQFAVWAAHFAPMHRSLLIFTDNASAVSWLTRMLDKLTGPIAGRLLCGLAYLRRETESAPAHVFHVPGPLNLMADFASRCRVISDTTFLSSFTARFSCQHNFWTLVLLNSEICASIISTLRGQRLDLPSWTVKSGWPHGRHVQNTAASTGDKTRTYPTSHPPPIPRMQPRSTVADKACSGRRPLWHLRHGSGRGSSEKEIQCITALLILRCDS